MERKDFEKLYNLYWEELYDFCFYHCKVASLTEEIVQDIFLSLWERGDGFLMNGEIRAYLYKAVKNKVFDAYREKARRQEAFDQFRLRNCDSACITEETVSYNELSDRLGIVIENLPCRCREVFRLSREAGLSNRQIAIRLSISEKTVEHHLTKALRIIRGKIDPLG